MANRGNVDEESLLEYIVNGLGGSKMEKLSLYEAKSFDELRVKLMVYDKIKSAEIRTHPNNKSQVSVNSTSSPQSESQQPSSSDTIIRCFNCGDVGHMSRECTKELKCFKCQGTGHRALECDAHQV